MMTNNRTRDILLYGAWALIAVVGGVLLQAEAALIALIATLPLSVLGLSDLLMGRLSMSEARMSSAVEPLSFEPPPSSRPASPSVHSSTEPHIEKPMVEDLPVIEPPLVALPVTPPRGIPIMSTVAPTALIQDLNRLLHGLQTVVIEQSGSLGEQSQRLKSIERTMGELSGYIGQVRREAVRLSASSNQARSALKNGHEAIGGALSGLNVTGGHVEQTAVALTELAKHIRRTGQIIAAVNEIATQSNFLALNAAIEAARADSADALNASSSRAFATVAEEVRALADQSRATVAQLHAVLLDAQHALEHATEVVEAGSQQAEQGALAARNLEGVFSALVEAIDETESAAQRIVVAVDRQSNGLETLAETLDDSGRFAEQARISLQLVDSATRDLERVVRERQPESAA